MLTGPLLIVTFVISIVFLLVTIIKFNMNAFVSLLLTSVLTALLVQMPVEDISSTITAGFSSTVGGIGIVTGLGVMLGMFLFESGGIISIANAIIRKFGVKNHQLHLHYQLLLLEFRCLAILLISCLLLWSEHCLTKQVLPV